MKSYQTFEFSGVRSLPSFSRDNQGLSYDVSSYGGGQELSSQRAMICDSLISASAGASAGASAVGCSEFEWNSDPPNNLT